MEVYKAISAVMATMAKEGISKDRRNQQQGYNFRGIDDVYNALGKVLADNQLVIIPRVVGKEREERTTAKGGMIMYTILTVEFDLVSAKDGSKALACTIGEAMDMADKSANKAQSAALKYAAMQIFMIPTEGDNDADSQTHEVAGKSAIAYVTPEQELKLEELARDIGVDLSQWLIKAGIASGKAKDLEAEHFDAAVKAIEKRRKPKADAPGKQEPLAELSGDDIKY